MQVEQGVRFELRLISAEADQARYEVRLGFADRELVGAAVIAGSAGAIDFSWAPATEPPAWALTLVRAALRSAFREHAITGRFPARITRWRPAPNEEEGA